MKAPRTVTAPPKNLRPRAEQRLAKSRRAAARRPAQDMQKLVQELQAQRIELEMQNEELRRTQLELQAARDRYADLYDFAPSAHLTVSASGEIMEANLNAGKLLGIERGRLLGRQFTRFVARESQDRFHLVCQALLRSDVQKSAELNLVNAQGRGLMVHLEAVRNATTRPKQYRFSLIDITERKRVEESLRQSEEQLAYALEGAGEGLWDWDIPSGRVYYSLRWLRDLGYASAVVPRTVEFWKGLIHPDDREHVMKKLQDHLAGRSSVYECECRLRAGSGEYRWRRDRGKVVKRDANGNPLRMVGVDMDITECKQAEDAWREVSQLNKQIIDGAKEGIIVYGRDLKYQVWNPFMEELTGLLARDVIGKHPSKVFPLLQNAGVMDQLRQALAGKALTSEDIHFQLPRSGHSGWISDTSSPLRNAEGEVIGVIGIVTDITERKQAEAALKAREAQLRTFVREAPAALAMFDRNMNYLAASQRWLSDCGLGHRDLVGLNHYEVFPDLPDQWKQFHRESLAGQVHAKDQDLWVRSNGDQVWLRWSMTPWRDADGAIGGIMLLTEDITRRKHAEESFRLFQTLANQSNDTFEVIDPKTGGILDVNEHGPAELGCTRAEYLSLRIFDMDPTFSRPGWRRLVATLRAQGSLRGEGIHRRKDGTTFPMEFNAKWVHLDRDYIVTVVRDITERRRTEERIAQLNRVQAILGGVNRAIVHLPDRQKLLDEVCRVAVKQGGFRLAWIGLVTRDGVIEPVARAGATHYLDGIRVVWNADEPEGRGPVGTAIRENRPVVVEDIASDEHMAPWRKRAGQFGLQYVAAFPIRVAGEVAGAFQVYAPRAGFFDVNELGLLTQVGDDISFALTAMAEVAARQEAEAALRRSERNLSNFFNQAPVGLLWLSASGTILRVNQAQLDLLVCPASECLGHAFNEFLAEPSQGYQMLATLAARKPIRSLRLALRARNGVIRLVQAAAKSIWQRDQLLYSSIFLRDVSDRVALEQEILLVGEREQRRIFQDLHDGLGQILIGAAYLANNLRNDLAAKGQPETSQADRLLELISEAGTQTRSLARGLHPVEPEPTGLALALQALASRTESLFPIRCHFRSPLPVLMPDNAVATHLFRIAQEAVTNALKHGKPGRIEISLTETSGRITLAVRDDGSGLPARPRKKPGMGLRIMHCRAGLIGGSLAVQKEAEGGTAVVCTVRLSGESRRAPPRRPARTKHRTRKE